MAVNPALRIAVTTLAVMGIGGVPLAVAQDSFQAEAGLSYDRTKGGDKSGDFRQDTVTLDGTYYFDKLPLQPRDYPLEQVPFVERASGLAAYYSRGSPHIEGLETVERSWSYNVAVQFTPPDTPLILGAGYGRSYSGKYRVSLGTGYYDTETDVKSYELRVGSYVDKTTAVTLDWSRSDGEGKITPSIFSSNLMYTSTSIGISGQHLARLADGEHLAVSASVTQTRFEPEGAASEKDQSYFVQATYYPTKMLGLWLRVQVDRGDSQVLEGETYLAGANMFVTPAVSLSLSYLRFQGKASDTAVDGVLLSGRIRF